MRISTQSVCIHNVMYILSLLVFLAMTTAAPVHASLTYVTCYRDGVDGVDGLRSAYYVAISQDGKHTYVAGFNDDAVALFERDGGARYGLQLHRLVRRRVRQR